MRWKPQRSGATTPIATREALAMQIQALDNDRARLASELDQAAARSRGLEAANRDVAQRIAQAIETINGVLTSEG